MTGGISYSYSFVGARRPPGRVTTSRQEILQIGIAYAVLTADLLIIFTDSSLFYGTRGAGLLRAVDPTVVGVAALAAATGFVAHEMAHKIVAQRSGFWAEFRMWPIGLVLSLVTAFIGFLWGAPGATVVGGMGPADRTNWGRTSLAGPLTNVGFAAVFYGLCLATVGPLPTLAFWLLLLAYINAWFGTFNLIPIGPLDGRKVLSWSPRTWAASIALTGSVAVIVGLALFWFQSPFLAW